jgi:hypothetical protein
VDLVLEKDRNFKGEVCLSVLANIVYGEPPILQLDYETLELRPSTDRSLKKASQVVLRKLEVERNLMQKISKELSLQLGRRVDFVGGEALDFMKRVQGWAYRGSGYVDFLPEEHQLEAHVQVKENTGASFHVEFVGTGSGTASGEKSASFETVFQAWQRGGKRCSAHGWQLGEAPQRLDAKIRT